MNATGVDQFHDDLQAAIVSGVPLDLHRSGTGDVLTVGRVNELRKQIQPHVDLSGKISVPDDSLEFSSRYIAALETFLQTRTMLPVLEGLTIHS